MINIYNIYCVGSNNDALIFVVYDAIRKSISICNVDGTGMIEHIWNG